MSNHIQRILDNGEIFQFYDTDSVTKINHLLRLKPRGEDFRVFKAHQRGRGSMARVGGQP